MKKSMYLLVALFLIIFEAVPEGLALGGHKTIAGIIEFIYRAGITLTVFAFFTKQYPDDRKLYETGLRITYSVNFWWIIAGYVLLRFALFDIIHNISAGIPTFSVGSTKVFDIVMSKLGSWGWFLKFCCALPGITFLMGWQHGIRISK
jgi:hypothetical protein